MRPKLRPLVAALLAATVLVPSLSAAGDERGACASAANAAAATGADPSCPGVRPGAWAFSTKDKMDCSFGFILRGSDGARYAILGHPCAPAARSQVHVGVGKIFIERTWPVGKGPQISDSTMRPVGRLVYDVNIGGSGNETSAGEDVDVALMRLDRGVTYSPTVCQFGGPHRINKVLDTQPEVVQIYGQGDEFIAGGPHGREDVVKLGLNDERVVFSTMVSEGNYSGAPVLAGDGSPALGVLSQSGFWGAEGAPIFRLGPLIKRFEKNLKIRLTLVSAGER